MKELLIFIFKMIREYLKKQILRLIKYRVIRKVNRLNFEDDLIKKLSMGVKYIYSGDVEGNIAEFGTGYGKSAIIISQAIKRFEKKNYEKRKLFLFDSFHGLPPIIECTDQLMPIVKRGYWREGSFKGLTKTELFHEINKIIPRDQIQIIDGWYSETLPKLDKTIKFAYIHIDCDLYQSTIDVLDFCFSNDLISKGAIIFFDDWNHNYSSNEFGERKAWLEIIKKYDVQYSDCGLYGWACWHFIIHSYNGTKNF